METNSGLIEEMFSWLDHMPKCLRSHGGKENYVPIIYKHEWDGHDNAWFAMYAKEGSRYFDPTNCALCVDGRDFFTAIKKFRDEFDRLSALGVFTTNEYHPEKLPKDEKRKRYAYNSIYGVIDIKSI